jgi:hypothetical protein
LRAEIQSNLNDLRRAVPGLKQWREQIDADLVEMKRIQENPDNVKNQHTILAIGFNAITLSDTAWRTA